jgi:hypothetical protein
LFHHPILVILVENTVDSAKLHSTTCRHQRKNEPFKYDAIKTGYSTLDQSRKPFYRP